jgi:NDP-sugar pyrophosphorylase family protein
MKVEKIAISIDPYLLREIESKIDGVNIKSRSQSIEFLLRKALAGNINTAFLLAGGIFGEKKAMEIHKGKPSILNLIEWMKNYGVNKFIISVNYNENSIRKTLGDGSKYGVKISYLVESSPCGTAGAVRGVQKMLNSPFIVANCDSTFNFDLSSLLSYHKKMSGTITIAVRETKKPTEYGVVEMEGDNVISFKEKPSSTKTNLVSTGIYIFNPSALTLLPENGMLEQEVFPYLAKKNQLKGYIFTSKWDDLEMMKK